MTSRRRIRKRLRLTAWTLATAGALALGYCAVEWQSARNYQQAAARQFDRELASPREVARPTPPRLPADGELVGRLEIPRLRLSAMVVEGTSERDLRRAVGHVPGTALPGMFGNVALAGHRDSFFRPLQGIRRNDTITLRTKGAVYRYRVASATVVGPRDVEVLRTAGRDELTLITCFPFYYIGAAPERFVVRAERVERASAAKPSVVARAAPRGNRRLVARVRIPRG